MGAGVASVCLTSCQAAGAAKATTVMCCSLGKTQSQRRCLHRLALLALAKAATRLARPVAVRARSARTHPQATDPFSLNHDTRFGHRTVARLQREEIETNAGRTDQSKAPFMNGISGDIASGGSRPFTSSRARPIRWWGVPSRRASEIPVSDEWRRAASERMEPSTDLNLEGVVQEPLERSQGSDHEDAGSESSPESSESDLGVDRADGGLGLSGSEGGVELGHHGVCGVRDNGAEHTSDRNRTWASGSAMLR